MNISDYARLIRRLTLLSIYHAGSGHPGGSLSIADILAVLYFEEMRIRPQEPKWIDRDRLVLSKGHACPTLYAVLALKGFFPEADLNGLRKMDSYLEGHPDIKIPGIDAPSGSLGMGLSQGLGMAMGARYTKLNFITYVILGDGDMEEGNTWEAIMQPLLIKTRYIFLKNERNLTKSQKETLKELQLPGLRIKSVRALRIRESFQDIYQAETSEIFSLLLRKWYFRATHSRLKPIIKAAKTIKTHWDGIEWKRTQINNGLLEGLNSIVQAAKAKAKGFATFKNFRIIIFLTTGKLKFNLVNPVQLLRSGSA